jgi:hypothetical protein
MVTLGTVLVRLPDLPSELARSRMNAPVEIIAS